MVWSYLLVTIGLVVFMRVVGDLWWPATLLLFSPRWLLLLPVLLLFPFAIYSNYRLLLPLITTSLIVVYYFMGFNLPFQKIIHSPYPSRVPAVRVLTCNIQSGKFDPSRLSMLINEVSADIVALQECPREFNLPLLNGWHFVQDGGLVVMSRYPLYPGKPLRSLHPPHLWPRTSLLPCRVSLPGGDVAFCNVHLPSPRYGIQNILDRTTLLNMKRATLLIRETEQRLKTARSAQQAVNDLDAPVIIAGDFNMPVESMIYRKVWSRFSNAFSLAGTGFGWTERVDIYGLPLTIRIDHILTGAGLESSFCRVGQDIGSDHLPVIADVVRSVL